MLLIETTGAFCTQAMAAVEKQTDWKPLVIMSATCASLNQFFKPLIDQGLTGKDTYIISDVKDVNDPAQRRRPDRQAVPRDDHRAGPRPEADDLLHRLDLTPGSWSSILKNAATYEGGLDRGNIMLAARNIDTRSTRC